MVSGAVEQSTLVERFVTSSRGKTTLLYFALATLVCLALTLVIFLRMPVMHPHLLVNGTIFLAVIGTVLVLNHYVATATASVR